MELILYICTIININNHEIYEIMIEKYTICGKEYLMEVGAPREVGDKYVGHGLAGYAIFTWQESQAESYPNAIGKIVPMISIDEICKTDKFQLWLKSNDGLTQLQKLGF